MELFHPYKWPCTLVTEVLFTPISGVISPYFKTCFLPTKNAIERVIFTLPGTHQATKLPSITLAGFTRFQRFFFQTNPHTLAPPNSWKCMIQMLFPHNNMGVVGSMSIFCTECTVSPTKHLGCGKITAHFWTSEAPPSSFRGPCWNSTKNHDLWGERVGFQNHYGYPANK